MKVRGRPIVHGLCSRLGRGGYSRLVQHVERRLKGVRPREFTGLSLKSMTRTEYDRKRYERNKMNATYPETPGHKGVHETGRDAARSVAAQARGLKELIVECLKGADLSPDECAALLRGGRDAAAFENFKRNVRSRFSELSAAAAIEPTAARELNSSGAKAVVWTLRKATNGVQQELI